MPNLFIATALLSIAWAATINYASWKTIEMKKSTPQVVLNTAVLSLINVIVLSGIAQAVMQNLQQA